MSANPIGEPNSPANPLSVLAVSGSVVSGVQQRWADDFGGSAIDPTRWEIELDTGNMPYSVASSNLTISMSTTPNAELRFLSKGVFTIPFDVSIIMQMSQRIANNQVFIDAVEVDEDGRPVPNSNKAGDWRNRASILLDSTATTSGRLETVGDEASVALSQPGVINTTTSPVGLGLELRAFDIQMLSWTPDTAAVRNATVILNSSEMPDPNKKYKLRLRFVNGSTAPGSSTNVVIKRIYVQDATEMSVEIGSGRGDNNAQRAVPVNLVTAPNITINTLPTGSNLVGDVGIQPRAGSGGLSAIARLLSAAASTNATLVKSAAGRLHKVRGYNASTSVRYLKFYNKATAPTPGTDTPIVTIALAPSQMFDLDLGPYGQYFATGIGFAITTGNADSDTGACTAGDIVAMSLWYI